MEWIKRMSLKKSLFVLTLVSLVAAAGLTALTLWIFITVGTISTPDGIILYVSQGYVIEPQTAAAESQTGGLLNLLALSQLLLPVLFFVGALLIAVFQFYRWKLKEPLKILNDATERIMKNDLDFSVPTAAPDELGQLCGAFETMRRTLLANNQQLWRQAEEQKRLNAAFSHDLRNPLTVLKGSARLAKHCAPDNEMLTAHLTRIEVYTKRLERYVEVMSSVGRLEQMQLDQAPVEPQLLNTGLDDALRLVAADSGKQIFFHGVDITEDIYIDKNAFFQIAENLASNALRFATERVSVSLNFDRHALTLEVTDDGCGFPPNLLKNGIQPFRKGPDDASHFGMGLYICKLLCEKHGGRIEIGNLPSGGARVRAVLAC